MGAVACTATLEDSGLRREIGEQAGIDARDQVEVEVELELDDGPQATRDSRA